MPCRNKRKTKTMQIFAFMSMRKSLFCRGRCTVNFAAGSISDTVPGSHAYLLLQGGAWCESLNMAEANNLAGPRPLFLEHIALGSVIFRERGPLAQPLSLESFFLQGLGVLSLACLLAC